MSWIAVTLQEDEKDALRQLAKREKRDVRAQAAWLIRLSLERGNLLPSADSVSLLEKELVHVGKAQ